MGGYIREQATNATESDIRVKSGHHTNGMRGVGDMLIASTRASRVKLVGTQAWEGSTAGLLHSCGWVTYLFACPEYRECFVCWSRKRDINQSGLDSEIINPSKRNHQRHEHGGLMFPRVFAGVVYVPMPTTPLQMQVDLPNKVDGRQRNFTTIFERHELTVEISRTRWLSWGVYATPVWAKSD